MGSDIKQNKKISRWCTFPLTLCAKMHHVTYGAEQKKPSKTFGGSFWGACFDNVIGFKFVYKDHNISRTLIMYYEELH